MTENYYNYAVNNSKNNNSRNALDNNDSKRVYNEKYLELQKKSIHNLKNAKQTIDFTYKMVKENKLLMGVVNELFLACSFAMGSLLYYELLHKRINFFEDKFESKLRIYKNKVSERYGLNPNYIKLMRDLKEIVIAHNQSPIEFSKGDKFVICSDNYELKQITLESLKEAFKKTNLFIDEVIYITSHK